MSKTIVTKSGIVIHATDTVTIPRSEYNKLLAAKVQIDMILSVADKSGYGCADIVKGARSLDEYSKALTIAEEHYSELVEARDETVGELTADVERLKEALNKAASSEPEEHTDA